jgi:hypothetical protein
VISTTYFLIIFKAGNLHRVDDATVGQGSFAGQRLLERNFPEVTSSNLPIEKEGKRENEQT